MITWRKKRQPTPVSLLGISHGRGAWRATVRAAVRAGHNLAAKPLPIQLTCAYFMSQQSHYLVYIPETILHMCFCRHGIIIFLPVLLIIVKHWKPLKFPSTMEKPASCVRATSLQWCSTLCNPMDCSPPGCLSMGFSKQEYWSGQPYPPPGDLSHPGIKPMSLMYPALAGGFFITIANWEAQDCRHMCQTG